MAKYSTQKDEEEKKKAQKAEQEKVKLAPSVTADVLKYAQELSGATKKNPASHTPDINPNKNTNIKKTADGDDIFVAPGMENLGPRAAKYVQNVALAGDEKAQKVFANQHGAISASMNTFKGFTDVDGNAVNMNTADLNSIIRSIRAEPNQKRRTAYAEALEKLTKTPGSRFFGAAFDKNNAKTFLNSAALSQNEYDKIVKKYESVFNPQAGHEEENVAAYAEAMEEIEAGGYDAYVKKARIDALNDAYRSQLATDTLPDLTSHTSPQEPQNAPEAAETPVAEQEPMPKGGAVWNTNGEAYTIVDGKAVKVTPDAAPEPIAPSAPSLQDALKDEKFKQRYLERLLEKEGKEAADFTKETLDSMVQKGVDSGDFAEFVIGQMAASSVQVASASPVRGVFKGKEKKETFGPERPTIQQENEHSLSQALRDEAFYGEYMSAVEAKNEIPHGSIDLSHDPIKAASYVAAGEVRQLTKETQDALAEIASESPGWRAVLGVTIDPTQDQLQAAQYGDAHARAFVDATRDYWATGDTNAILGSTLTSYLNLSKSDRFPPSLRDDMQGAIAELAYRAEQAYKNGEFSYDPAKETLYDAYTKLNPASMQLVRGVKKQVHDMYLERKQAEKLAYDEAAKNEQELLKQHREQVASGNYTQEAYDHVLMEAPKVTTQSARTDATYNAMFQEIAMDRTLSDGMEDSWYNQMAEVYLRENGLPDDLFSVAAMQYKDTLAAFEKDLLLSDMRVAATLDYADLGSMYEKWGGMDVDKLHERAEIALKQMAANVTDEEIAVLSQQNLYTGTGEEVGNVEAFGIGAAHGVLDTSGEMLEGIWAFSSMSKEDSVAAVYKVRQDWNKRYGVFAGTDMYKHAMYEYCDLIPEEHGKAIREYLDAGYDPFRLGIDPTNESIILETSKKLDGRAKAIQKWAFGALDAKQGKVFEVGSATGSTLTMQTVATVTQLGTHNPLIGSLVGYGLVSGNQQIKEELANGATRKEAKTMGYLRAWSDSVANMISSDKFTEKLRCFVGFGPLVAKGLDAAGDIASARGSLGMIKRYGNIVGKAIKGAGEQILEETVVDPMLEGTTWQIAEAGGRAYLGGAGFIQSVFNGLANIDVMESVEVTVKDAGMNFISTLPLAIIGGLGDGFKASRAAATKLMATGDADAAQAFVEAVVSDLEVPENRDTLNAALHDAAVGEEAAVIAMTDDENGGTDIDIGAKAQEQADAHAKSEENSMAAAEAGLATALAAQESMNNGEINPELVTQVANGVLANAKNSQSVLEHRREKNQKQAEADAAFAEGMKKATAKAEAEVSAREEAIANPPQEQVDPAHNARVMEVNRYVEENYPNGVDDEQWQAIYDEFEADDGELSADEETAPEAKLTKANAEFAAQISRKFGVDVRFGNLAGAEGAYIRKANTIFLDQNATQGEMIKRVMVHELTHRTEGTAAYKELENALISLKYGENTKQLDADIAAKRREYQSQLAEMGRTGVFDETGARKEIIADICSELISGNDEMINRLVAEKPSVARQILNAIKDFINRLRGVKNPELDNLRRIEGLLEQGLLEADAPRMQTADAEYAKAAANGNLQDTETAVFYTPKDAQMSLPSKPYLKQEVSAWRKAKRAEAQREEESRKGERQFVGKTLQNSRAMPSYIRQTLFNDPTSRFYDRDSNDEQIIRAYQTIAQEGKEAAIERILTSREMPTKDEIAQANVLMAQAAHDGDMSTLLALSRHYAEDTTEVAQALQAMKIFKRMTPAGAMSASAAQNEALLSGYIEGHAPVRQEVEAEARHVSEDIEGKDGRDPIALLGSGETTLTRENSKWGIPINERQEALIKHYKLENVTRPGIHYNRATVKQRMLEAILATPDPLEATNEGMTLVTRLEYMKKGAPVITNADLEYIGRQLAIYASMDADSQDAREGQLALARAYEANANITQAGKFEKINGARFINMLLNLTSPTRNVMGNVLQTSVNSLSNVVANILDVGVSLATKERTKAMITPKEAVEGWEAFAQETMDTYRDYFVDKAIVKQGEGRFDVNRRGRIYQGEAAETARITESFLMSVGDRNFWKMAYVNSMNEQMRVAKKNGVELDYEAARARAEQEANYATFNEDNKVRDAMNALKNAGIIGKGIDLLMPFTGVPTNIVKRQLEYGPVGLAYTSIKHAVRAAKKENFDQKAFVEELARGLTGTGLMALGFGLKQLGMITGGTGEEEDTAAYYMRTARGEQYTPFIKVGDQYVSLSTFAPAVSPILMGATAYDAWKNDENIVQAFASATAASLDSIIDASYFSAIQDILTGDGTFAENLEQTLLTSIATQSTPSLMSQMASYLDSYVRDTKDKNWMKQTLNKAIARVPILRETLPVKYDVTGEAVKNTKEGWRAFLDPFTTTEAENDKAVDELLALYKRTGEARGLTGYLISSNSYKLSVTKTAAKKAGAGSEGYSMELTTEQKQAINQKYADILFNGDDGIRKLIESRRWQTMSDEERVDEIADLRSEAKLEVTVWAIKQYGKKE